MVHRFAHLLAWLFLPRGAVFEGRTCHRCADQRIRAAVRRDRAEAGTDCRDWYKHEYDD